jgi:membrane-associated protein
METLIAFATSHAESAHWLFAFLILLGGLNVPISEDIVMISAGALASTCLPEMAAYQYSILMLACWIAAWEAYWIGRKLGPKITQISWFNRILNEEKIERLHRYYEKYGVLTFIVGRFIPGGVRNCLFMTSGMGKMSFTTFIARDFPACLISTAFLFYLGYFFGQHADRLIVIFRNSHNTILLVILSLIMLRIFLKKIQQLRNA